MDCIYHDISGTCIYTEQIPSDSTLLYENATDDDIKAVQGIRSQHRQKEILLTRQMLRNALGEQTTLAHDANGAPFILGSKSHISISHCADQVVIAINEHHPIGIDIEIWRSQLLRIKKRFLSLLEMDKYDTPQLLLSAWTMKEALYKAVSAPGIVLADDIRLPLNSPKSNVAEVVTPSGKRLFNVYELLPCADTRSLSLAVAR